MKNEYWQHKTSGEIYAVMVDYNEYGPVVSAACGPLPQNEVRAELLDSPYFEYDNDPEVADGLEHDEAAYQVYTGAGLWV